MADISSLESEKVFDRLCTASGDLSWVTIAVDTSVPAGGKPKAVVVAEGDGGLDQLKALGLSDDHVQYGAVKVLGIDNKGAVTSTRLKIIFFQWVRFCSKQRFRRAVRAPETSCL
jgi:hypothetical protein